MTLDLNLKMPICGCPHCRAAMRHEGGSRSRPCGRPYLAGLTWASATSTAFPVLVKVGRGWVISFWRSSTQRHGGRIVSTSVDKSVGSTIHKLCVTLLTTTRPRRFT